MSELQLEIRLENGTDFRADALLGDTVFEVLVAPRGLRNLRAAVLTLANLCASKSQRRAILILDEPQISMPTLDEELHTLPYLFRPEITEKLSFVIRREDHPNILLGAISPEEQQHIDTVADHARSNSYRPARRPSESFFDILRVLLIHWIRKAGPLTSKELSQH